MTTETNHVMLRSGCALDPDQFITVSCIIFDISIPWKVLTLPLASARHSLVTLISRDWARLGISPSSNSVIAPLDSHYDHGFFIGQVALLDSLGDGKLVSMARFLKGVGPVDIPDGIARFLQSRNHIDVETR
jgi:hypothetical protein